MKTGRIVVGLVTLGMLLVGVIPSLAAGVVSPCTETNLKSVLAGGGLITFNCGTATITLTSPLDITAPDTTIEGAGTITLDGGGNSQIIRHRSLSTPSTLTLKNLTIKNGSMSGANASANGGAIWSVFQGSSPANKPTLNVINVSFSNNISNLTNAPTNAPDYGGGAIYSQGGYVNVTDSTFMSNHTNGSGGAIHILRSNIVISKTSFFNNFANDNVNHDSQGGAIYIDGMQTNGIASFSDSIFSANTTYNEGGAIYIHMYQGMDTFTVNRSNFISNAVTDGNRAQGGAISGGNGKVTITNSTFIDNAAYKMAGGDGSGGAISMTQPAVITIANSTFSYNQAQGNSYNANGGAIYIVNNTAQFKIINSTIANNSAGWAGGGISSSTNGILQNTILANNTANNGPNHWGILQQCSAPLTNGGGNIQYPNRNPNPNYYNEVVCATGITIADPQLQALANQYSPMQTFALIPGSPAIDHGNPAVCAAAPINNRDERNQPRLIDGDNNGSAVCDSGAYEYNSAPLLAYTQSNPTLTWNRVTWAQNYQIQVDVDSAFNNPLIDVVLPASTLSVTPTGFAPNLFFWRVRAQQTDGTWGGWSIPDSFVVGS